MTRSETADYAAVLKIVKPLVPNIRRFMLDFEKSLWLAIPEVFGGGISLKGCGFHYVQAIYKNMRRFGLEVRT